jgi:cell division protein FtsB
MGNFKDIFTTMEIYQNEIKQLRKQNKNLQEINHNLIETNILLYDSCNDLINELAVARYEMDGK